MIRKILTIVSLIGLFLSVAAWGVSYWDVSYVSNDRKRTLILMRGCFAEMRCGGFNFVGGTPGLSAGGFSGFQTWLWNPDGYMYRSGVLGRSVVIPLWLPSVLCLALLWSSRWLKITWREQWKTGLCVTCGYDLRASKDRCSECGEEFEIA